jgi:chromosomal replication initiator protein
MRCAMREKPKQPELDDLPDFLQIGVRKRIVDERTAHRLELCRRTRGLGKYASRTALMNDPPDPNLTFENYVVTNGNSLAVELAGTVASQSPSQLPYNPLYLYGDVGLGKTHLLSAIANAAEDREVLLLNTADLETELERAERLKSRAELREWLTSVEILLVDDVQLCEGREELQRDLFSVLNHMIRAHRWVVISSDVPPTRLSGVESRLLSRFGGGVIVSLQMGDKTERLDLIRHFLDSRSMPEDVVTYLAENITDNIRRLKAAVAQLLTFGNGTQNPLDLDMARALVPVRDDDQQYKKQFTAVSVNSGFPDPAITRTPTS